MTKTPKLPRSTKDVRRFITNKVQEDLHLDYKDSRAISEGKLHEIAKDVSAFANSDGGMIIYGVREEKHIPVEIDGGVDHLIFSRERLEQIISSNVAPRIEGLRISQIPLNANRSCFVVHTPKSYRGPHQERTTKKYYKRFNFSSEPMEDYEITDIRSRAQTIPRLIRVDVAIRDEFMMFLSVANIGNIPAENVRFEFSPPLNWRFTPGYQTPSLFVKGARYFPPGREFLFFYAPSPEVHKKAMHLFLQFDVTVFYTHPLIAQEFTETFHIDLEDFMDAAVVESDIKKQGDAVKKVVGELASQFKTLNESIKDLSRIAGASGLNLSVTTLRNLTNLTGPDERGTLERIDPNDCDYRVFKEVLNISDDLAFSVWDHFRGGGSTETLSEVKGITEDVLQKMKRYFVSEVHDVRKDPPSQRGGAR